MKKFNHEIIDELIERFFRYTAIPSQSDESESKLPSSPGQMELAKLLKSEMEEMGLSDIDLTDDAILSARIPGNPDKHPIGFVAHLDTVDAGLSPVINPQILVKQAGQDLLLNSDRQIWLREAQIPEIKEFDGQDIIVSDGTSVLGADNKSAIAITMTLANQLINTKKFDHGNIYLAFVPDEEIGLRGSKALDPSRLPVTCAYTIDSSAVGELIYETFNAGSAVLTIEGVSAHPMSAKNVLVNPVMVATDAINMLDRAAQPEHTELKEGYIWPTNLNANPSEAVLIFNIRDHNRNQYEKKKETVQIIYDWLCFKYPTSKITLDMEDVYGNIADSIASPEEPAVAVLHQAMENLGITPKYIAMRGGTDGSALSPKGIPTPNYFTGAHQFHSRYEFLPVNSFHLSYQVTEELIKGWAELA